MQNRWANGIRAAAGLHQARVEKSLMAGRAVRAQAVSLSFHYSIIMVERTSLRAFECQSHGPLRVSQRQLQDWSLAIDSSALRKRNARHRNVILDEPHSMDHSSC